MQAVFIHRELNVERELIVVPKSIYSFNVHISYILLLYAYLHIMCADSYEYTASMFVFALHRVIIC